MPRRMAYNPEMTLYGLHMRRDRAVSIPVRCAGSHARGCVSISQPSQESENTCPKWQKGARVMPPRLGMVARPRDDPARAHASRLLSPPPSLHLA